MDSTYILLQHYWWFLVSLLGALLVFLLFVQGGQSLLFTIGKTEIQQKMLLNSTGRKWEFTFTTLVTFGGAFFASFPLFYSTSFGGAYWVWMLILLCFVIQAVSYEYRAKKGNLLGKKTYQVFLMINGIAGPILLGTAVATFFNGAEFIVNKEQLTDVAMPVISTWANPWHGLEAALVFWNLCLGLAVFFLARALALLYFINNIDDPEICLINCCRPVKDLIHKTKLLLCAEFFHPAPHKVLQYRRILRADRNNDILCQNDTKRNCRVCSLIMTYLDGRDIHQYQRISILQFNTGTFFNVECSLHVINVYH